MASDLQKKTVVQLNEYLIALERLNNNNIWLRISSSSPNGRYSYNKIMETLFPESRGEKNRQADDRRGGPGLTGHSVGAGVEKQLGVQ